MSDTPRPQWKKVRHIYGDRCTSIYREEKLGVQLETWCFRKKGDGPMGYEYYGGGEAFFIDGDKREFATEAEMMQARAALAEKEAKP